MIEPGEGPVVSLDGGALKSVRTAWRQARKRAKLDSKVTLYSFRHTLPRYIKSKGTTVVPIDQLQVVLGHKRLGVTERYAEFDPTYLREVTACIEAFWAESAGQLRAKTGAG
jgi:integrase